ncbi:class A beta-lactamase [Celeribacter naphthalenivorans]|uniref:class A beta-lactamase n=1 Tax=Celeribacter naphthalenivorans TaxID=1614694 RepID=UPI001CF95174|nr:class A beta-lactamase [Celeribacter naphthalenivorans]
MKRRDFMLGAAILPFGAEMARAQDVADTYMQAQERALTARIGVCVQNLATGQMYQRRGAERFAMCSTFKASLAALCLREADRGALDLDEQLTFRASELLPTSPVTKRHADAGKLDIRSLCQAAVEYSDNTAANLLLARVGGPAAVTQFFRDMGDPTSRLDRIEMALNSSIPGDERDTTTPLAMTQNVRRMTMPRGILSDGSRAHLVDWMRNEQNAKNRIRAAVPSDWVVANKPGTTPNGAANDIAALWSPEGTPFVMSVYIDTEKGQARAAVDAMRGIAEVALAKVL